MRDFWKQQYRRDDFELTFNDDDWTNYRYFSIVIKVGRSALNLPISLLKNQYLCNRYNTL
jgi:hypothetical protein